MAILCVACLTSAVVFALRPDPWGKAEQKALLDARKFADLIASPDRLGWRLSEDVSLLRVMVWDADGARQYPPPGGLVPLAFEFSEDTTRRLTAVQADLDVSEWISFDTAGRELLHCRGTPAVCLIYDRSLLEETLGVRPGVLASATYDRQIAAFLAGLAALFSGAAMWLRRRATGTTPGFKVVPERHIAIRGTLEVSLTPRDLKLLSILEEREGAVVTKDELYDAGWGRDYMPNSRALDQHMINLRRKLDPDKSRPVLIETVHGVGYRLVQ